MNDMIRQFRGVWIPREVWLNRELSLTEKVMLVEIESLQDEVRGCFASNAHFAEFFALSNSRVSEIVSSLAEKGLIDVRMIREGKRVVERQIRLCTPFEKPNTPSENCANPFGKGDEPPSEKAKGSNPSLSNTKRPPSGVVASRLPADWSLPNEWLAWAVSETSWQPEHIHRIAMKFRDFWVAAPGARGRKADWLATWRNWIRREYDDTCRRGNRSAPRASRFNGVNGVDRSSPFGNDADGDQ